MRKKGFNILLEEHWVNNWIKDTKGKESLEEGLGAPQFWLFFT